MHHGQCCHGLYLQRKEELGCPSFLDPHTCPHLHTAVDGWAKRFSPSPPPLLDPRFSCNQVYQDI